MTYQPPQLIQPCLAELNQIILGKENQVQLALACLLAGGHLLLEDLPGMGKTTLAHALAGVCGLNYQRVQFTSDLLPGDLLGASIFDPASREFHFHPGPIFSEMLLADELNRASPKAQSALLEAMEEQQISMDGKTRPLPKPFFVIATQNPQTQAGTFPLPESQLDRFLVRVSLGYPDTVAERTLLRAAQGRRGEKGEQSEQGKQAPILNKEAVLTLQALVGQVQLTDHLLDYIQRLLKCSRDKAFSAVGLSPRGGQALVRSTQAWALLQGRRHVLPEDVQAVFVAVAGHRLPNYQGMSGDMLAQKILQHVDVIG